MVNWLTGSGAPSTYGIPNTTKNIVVGLYIAKEPSMSYTGINLSSNNVTHPL
jgi:hypothetical protein